MAIVDEDLEQVRSTLVLSDVVQEYVALRRQGRNWVGLCPFHAEKSGSFNVRDETGRYRCFGCGAAGDVFNFVQQIEHVDFVTAVESLAAKAGVQLRYTSGGEGRDRQRRKGLFEAMEKAVEWYHQQLLTAPAARQARDYLRARGLSGDVARRFRLGWAPDDWDALARDLRLPADVLREVGLGFTNKAGRMQDSFRARVMFPIFTENGDPVAFGGRILPGSTDPAKYKNSSETVIYAKSKTLYGLHWAKNDMVASDQVIVCEGYTDVIGFHRRGVPRAVATCGTALTEEHVQILKNFTRNIVLAYDADNAGQSAAEKWYTWEQRLEVGVRVAALPDGGDPADLFLRDADDLLCGERVPVGLVHRQRHIGGGLVAIRGRRAAHRARGLQSRTHATARPQRLRRGQVEAPAVFRTERRVREQRPESARIRTGEAAEDGIELVVVADHALDLRQCIGGGLAHATLGDAHSGARDLHVRPGGECARERLRQRQVQRVARGGIRCRGARVRDGAGDEDQQQE